MIGLMTFCPLSEMRDSFRTHDRLRYISAL